MFYSRPQIEPFGWDLVALPTPNGSRNFDGLTSDGCPLDFRFSSGWLTVERGEPGASPDDEMEEIMSMQISPFGTVDISPEQICDILGLTVKGSKVSLSQKTFGDRGFDWSGETTCWHSGHRLMLFNDAETLATMIAQAFPGSVIVQPYWPGTALRVRCRQVKYLMNTDTIATFGIDCDRTRLERMLAAEEVPTEEFESIFARRIDLVRRDWNSQDLTGRQHINERGAAGLELDYQVTSQRQYDIRMEFPTADLRSQSIMKELLTILNSYFYRGFDVVNLQTGAVMYPALHDEEDTQSYSRSVKDWCLAEPRRYLEVGIEGTAGKIPPLGHRVFIGYRPIGLPFDQRHL